MNNGTFEYNLTDIKITETRTTITTETGNLYLKGNFMFNDSIIVFLPTHYKINRTDWREINYNKNESKESNDIDSELLAHLNVMIDSIINLQNSIVKIIAGHSGAYKITGNKIDFDNNYIYTKQ